MFIDTLNLFFWILLLLVAMYWCIFLFKAIFGATPFVPSRNKNLDKVMQKYIKNPSNKNFVDIGSGDGRVVFFASSYNFASLVGIEYNYFLVLLSRFARSLRYRRKNIKFEFLNFEQFDFSTVDVIYSYVFAHNLENVSRKILSESKNGTVIISKTFNFPNFDLVEKYFGYNIYIVKK